MLFSPNIEHHSIEDYGRWVSTFLKDLRVELQIFLVREYSWTYLRGEQFLDPPSVKSVLLHFQKVIVKYALRLGIFFKLNGFSVGQYCFKVRQGMKMKMPSSKIEAVIQVIKAHCLWKVDAKFIVLDFPFKNARDAQLGSVGLRLKWISWRGFLNVYVSDICINFHFFQFFSSYHFLILASLEILFLRFIKTLKMLSHIYQYYE